MIESNASLSEEPIDLLEQVDLVAILKAKIPEENINREGSCQLIEISDPILHDEIMNRGQFLPSDLEIILRNEESLRAAVEILAKENARLTTVAVSKEEKIVASIEMIVSQRDWVHSLLDDNVNLRSEIDRHVKEKLDFDADTAYQISALKTAKEELEEETINLKAEVQQLENQVIDVDEQIKKSAGVLKKSQVHKNALSEKIEAMENNQVKYKWYMGILSAAAFVFFSFAVATYFNSKTQNKLNPNNLISSNDETLGNSNLVDKNNLTNMIVQDSPIDVTPEGFISSNAKETTLEDNTAVLDDNKVDAILKDSNVGFDDNPEIKIVTTKKPVTKPSEMAVTPKSPKTTEVVVNKPIKPVVTIKKPVKTEIVTNKKPKKPNQSYVIQPKDSLYQISKKFYGSGNYVNKIKKENKLGNSLVPGKKLIIYAIDEE